ncbi:MAG: GAF domain-containing protein [Anaerolineales bacterium]|jgi:GAF domain-containing protein|nr:GAF domain-containing protein [Chloroflexota bacterium]MBK6646617.1 GAF domain-containing protein [Anaerolineales bacterium]MCC6984975.1 GAF domain-containing protein [Anaerolineales bacterium]
MDQTGYPVSTLREWRSAFIRATLVAACVFGLAILISSFFSNNAVYQGIYTVLYIVVLAVTFLRINENIKAGALIVILYVVAVSSITQTGIRGDGARLFMIGAIAMAALLFSWRAGWIMLSIGIVTLISAGWLILAGLFIATDTEVPPGGLEDWITNIISLLGLSALIIQGIRLTQTEFENSRERLLTAFDDLSRERASLEDRILERTRSLDKKTVQLQAVAEVGKSIASYRNLSELLQRAALLIHENFGYYHVGVFLLDDRKEFAVLAASNSEGGKRMLEKKHSLKAGETGIVGYVAESLRARIALDVGADAVYFNNPDLPNTRSEMALPLIASGQILGVLDVQSVEARAFTEDDIATIQVLADQLAIAIQNANLFSDTERALESSRSSYGQLSREAWGRILRSQARINYLSTPPATVKLEDETVEPVISRAIESGDLILGSDGLTISVPVKIRGQVIGALRLKKPEIAEAWTQDETALAISLADQLSGALESARLYRESQQRAARESLVSDISTRISASTTRDAIIRETVQELGQALNNATVTFQLIDRGNGREHSGSPSSSVHSSITE